MLNSPPEWVRVTPAAICTVELSKFVKSEVTLTSSSTCNVPPFNASNPPSTVMEGLSCKVPETVRLSPSASTAPPFAPETVRVWSVGTVVPCEIVRVCSES